jgi:hypothetical protein
MTGPHATGRFGPEIGGEDLDTPIRRERPSRDPQLASTVVERLTAAVPGTDGRIGHSRPAASARWWAEAFGWEVTLDTPDEAAAEVAPPPDPRRHPCRHRPGRRLLTVMADPEGNELCVLSPR